jgi:hypothetical protein
LLADPADTPQIAAEDHSVAVLFGTPDMDQYAEMASEVVKFIDENPEVEYLQVQVKDIFDAEGITKVCLNAIPSRISIS